MNVREGTEVLIEHRLAALTIPHIAVKLLLCIKKYETTLNIKDSRARVHVFDLFKSSSTKGQQNFTKHTCKM